MLCDKIVKPHQKVSTAPFKRNATLLFQPTPKFKGERENIILPYNNPFNKMSHFLCGEACTAVPSLLNGTE